MTLFGYRLPMMSSLILWCLIWEIVGRLENALQTAFALRIPVTVAANNALPRSELKARRWIRQPA